MTNKLYTEEQVIKAIDLAKAGKTMKLMWSEIKERDYSTDEIINQLTPIELPSDEEIEEALFHQSNEYAIGFHDAFDWLKNKLSQNR